MFKTIIAAAVSLAAASAIAAPVVGIYASIPDDQTNKVNSSGLEKLVFTSGKLVEPATFSYFQDRGTHYLVACCVDVKDVTPVTENELIKKYSGSADFASAIKGIKGYKFIYRVTYSGEHSTKLLKAEASTDNQGGMLRFSPAAQVVIDSDRVKTPFAAGATNIDLKSDVSKGKAPREIYTFTVDGKKSVFSFPEANPE